MAAKRRSTSLKIQGGGGPELHVRKKGARLGAEPKELKQELGRKRRENERNTAFNCRRTKGKVDRAPETKIDIKEPRPPGHCKCS